MNGGYILLGKFKELISLFCMWQKQSLSRPIVLLVNFSAIKY